MFNFMTIMIIQNNLRSSIICFFFSGGMYISSGFSFDLPIEVILSAILFPIKSPLDLLNLLYNSFRSSFCCVYSSFCCSIH